MPASSRSHPDSIRLARYLRRMQRVHGWLHPYSARFIADVSRVQRDAGIAGGVGEIGVHMGRLFIVLKLTAAPSERTFAIDVFGDQHLNVDQSGFGDRATFLGNVERWTGNRSVEILQNSSLEVRPADILALVGACRLVSIDGGHTADCVQSDLRLIESVLMPMGVAVMDDFYNDAWPAVADGGARYFFDSSTALRPFAVTPNKLYLARHAAHDFYRRAVRASQARWHDKTVAAFGSEIEVFGCLGPYHRTLYARVQDALKRRTQSLVRLGKRFRF